jgi:hypothetical protein
MSNPVTLDLVTPEATILAPDNLLVGSRGAVYTDIAKVRAAAAGTLERGTLLVDGAMDGEKVFVPCAVADLAQSSSVALSGDAEEVEVPSGARTYGILADTVTIEADEHAETAIYFEGDFNSNAVILPWETDADDHEEQIELARESLRRQKIFLRNVHK